MIKAIIFDYGYTIYDPEKNGFQPDALAVIKALTSEYKLILVSRTKDTEARLAQIEKIGFDQFFDFIQVLPKEETKNFENILKHYKFKPEEYFVLGDRITSEISEGNRLGMKTCRFRYGPEKNLLPADNFETADYEIENLSEVLDILTYGDIN